MNGRAICPKCKGNGYLSIKLQDDKDIIHKDCKYCDNRGEISLDGKKIEKYLNYSRMIQ
jgi:excinuclease UvrABC ATPase subunit